MTKPCAAQRWAERFRAVEKQIAPLTTRQESRQSDDIGPERLAAKHVLDLGRLVMQRGPPLAGAARQQHHTKRAAVAFGTTAELLGDSLDLDLAALGIVY